MNALSPRLRRYAAVAGEVLPGALVISYLLALWSRFVSAEGLAPADFQCFWAASEVALTDGPTAVYDMGVFKAAQRALHGRPDAPACMFVYPPQSLLLFMPLALLP